MTKRTHKSVHYGPGHRDGDHCGICAHFLAPHDCELVQSPVEAMGWCELYRKRRQPMAAKHHEVTAAHRRHERGKHEMRERHNREHHEMSHRHNKEEADLHAKQEAELAAEALGTPGGAAPDAGAAAPANPAGAPAAPGPAGGQAGAQPMPAGA